MDSFQQHARTRRGARSSPRAALVAVACATATWSSAARAAPHAFHAPAVIRGLGQARRPLSARDAKLDARLRAAVGLEPSPAPAASAFVATDGPWRQGETLHVLVHVAPGTDPAALRARGLTLERTLGDVVEGTIAVADTTALADLDAVRSIRPARPGRLRVTADGPSRAALARATGYDGTGVTIGVISDGAGSLPASVVPGGCAPGTGAEGQALIQVAQTLAPGATLRFASGIASGIAFEQAIQCLEAAGARVIVDDLGFYDEPFFEDGPVANATRAAVQAGVSFHSATGNDGEDHYGAPFKATAGSSHHDFAASGAADNYDEIDVAAGDTLDCVLQWNDPFGAAADDYDLELYDLSTPTPALITQSTNRQTGTQDPLEEISVKNTATTAGRAGVAITKFAGADRTLALFCFGGQTIQYVTPAGSIVGHPAVPEVVAVGAMDASDPGLDTVEAFSSRGPVEIDFPAPETRAKPDLVAFDGVTTSVPGFNPFFGTSAAAPDSAAVAALLLSKAPCLTPARIKETLMATAVDVGTAGFDPVAGAGRLDALAAIEAVGAGPCADDAACDDGNACTVDRCDGCACVHTLSCDDGNPCTADACDPAVGCVHTALADGASCADADVCNGAETCRAGACTAGSPLDCTADACATAGCDATAGCTSAPLEGFAGVSCVCGLGLEPAACSGVELPRGVRNRFRRACRLVARAARRRNIRVERALVRHALSAFAHASAGATSALNRGTLTATCADAVVGAVGDATARTQQLAGQLATN
jgi:hypothetical protein